MAKYSYIPPEYKTNTNNMSTTTLPTTPPRPRTQQNYNDTTKNRALDYSPQPTSKSMSSFPIYWADQPPAPWELEVAMAVSKAKPKRKLLPLVFTTPSPWEYEVAMQVSERTPTPKPAPIPKPMPEPKPKTKPYTSKFTEVGVDDFSEPYKADYRAKIDPDYGFELEHEHEQKKGGKMAQVVKDICKGFHGTGRNK
jgi:hypothetical protein